MARFNSARNSFLSGEITPKALGRFDLEQFSQACQTLKNAVLLPQGGASRRTGTELMVDAVAEVANKIGVQDYVRQVPFVFNANEAYNVIFLKNVDKPVIIKSSGDVVPAASITRKTPSLHVGTTAVSDWDGFTSDRALQELQYTQVNDYLFIVHKDTPPFAVRRTATDTFQIVQFHDFARVGLTLEYARMWPFMEINISSTTLTIGSTSSGASTTLTASASMFQPGHVGSLWKITNSGSSSTGYCIVTGYTSGTVVSVKNISAFADTTATANWYEPYWSDYRGWPRTVGYFESRLVYGGNASFPGTEWGSQVNDISQLSTDVGALVTNTDPFVFTAAGTQANEIQWLSPSKTLRMGTLGQEMSVAGSDNSQGLGPLNLGYTEQTNYGSQYKMAAKVDNAPVFVQRSGGKLRELVFNFEEDNFRATNLSFLADHMVPDSQLAFQQDRGIVWCKRKDIRYSSARDHYFMGMTRDKTTGVLGFHQHELGGADTGLGFPTIQSMIVLPSSNGTADQLWIAVQRFSNGNPKIFIERMALDFEYELSDMSGYAVLSGTAVYLDCATIKSVTLGDDEITGLDDVYEGRVVDVFSAKGKLGRYTVTSNTISLGFEVPWSGNVTIGFPYETVILPTEAVEGSQIGTGAGAMKRIDRAVFKFYKTGYAKYGTSRGSNFDEINLRPSTTPIGDPTPLFTGDKDVIVSGVYDRNLQVRVSSDEPLPLTLLCVTYRGATND